jgi:hypothetical protein
MVCGAVVVTVRVEFAVPFEVRLAGDVVEQVASFMARGTAQDRLIEPAKLLIEVSVNWVLPD